MNQLRPVIEPCRDCSSALINHIQNPLRGIHTSWASSFIAIDASLDRSTVDGSELPTEPDWQLFDTKGHCLNLALRQMKSWPAIKAAIFQKEVVTGINTESPSPIGLFEPRVCKLLDLRSVSLQSVGKTLDLASQAADANHAGGSSLLQEKKARLWLWLYSCLWMLAHEKSIGHGSADDIFGIAC